MNSFQFIIDFLKNSQERVFFSNFVSLAQDIESVIDESDPNEITIFVDNVKYEDNGIIKDLKSLLEVRFKQSNVEVRNWSEYDPNEYATVINIRELISNE